MLKHQGATLLPRPISVCEKSENTITFVYAVVGKGTKEFASLKEGFVIADDNREGIRVSTPNGWVLLRLSVHDPVMPMNFESNEVGGIDIMKDELREFFESFSELEIPRNF